MSGECSSCDSWDVKGVGCLVDSLWGYFERLGKVQVWRKWVTGYAFEGYALFPGLPCSLRFLLP